MQIVERPFLSGQTFYNQKFNGPGNKRIACIQSQLKGRGVSQPPDKVIQGALKAGLSTAEILDYFSRNDVQRISPLLNEIPPEILSDYNKTRLIIDLGIKATEKGVKVYFLFASALRVFFKACPNEEISDHEKFSKYLNSIFDLGIKAFENGIDVAYPFRALPAFFSFCPNEIISIHDNFRLIFDLGIKAVEKWMKVAYPFHTLPAFFEFCPNEVISDHERFENALNSIHNPLCFPELARQLHNILFRLNEISFVDSGNNPTTFPDWAKPMLLALPAVETAKLTVPKGQSSRERGLEEKNISEVTSTDAKFVRALGRTLIYKTNGKYIAVKLLKEGEMPEALFREHDRLIELRGKNLESIYPKPLGVYRLNGISDDHLQKITALQTVESKRIAVKKDERTNYPYTALVYTAPDQNYFTYLNDPDLSEDQFLDASYRGIKDLFSLARDNLIHFSLIDLFHNVEQTGRDDGGRFLWMAEINRQRMDRFGVGRMNSHTGAVEFPNWRLSGIADLADTAALSDLMDSQNEASAHLREFDCYEAKASNFYLANYLGDYLLAWTQLTGDRYRKLGLLDWKDPGKINHLARTLASGYITAFSTFTGIPEESAEPFLRTSINWERLARQMCFFMTEDYVPYLKNGKVPEIIYGEEVEVYVDPNIQSSRGWRDKGPLLGWSFDGKTPDLGPVNGPFPLQELIRSLYLTATYMIALKQPEEIKMAT